MQNVTVALARTQAAYKRQAAVKEIQQLYVDAIASARQTIYIENQYFTAPVVANAIEARLKEKQGPQVAMVLPSLTDGWLSRYTMDVLRVRQIRKLKQADTQERFRAYFCDGQGLENNPLNMHAKLMIVDDDFITVGSANLNNRSMGLDNECNIAIVANGDKRIKQSIAAFRNRLLSEHLDCKPEDVERELARQPLLAAIESLSNREKRFLQSLPLELPKEVDRYVPDTEIVDPEYPIEPESLIKRIIPEEEQKPARYRIIYWLLFIGAVAALAAMWRWTPLGDWVDMDAVSAAIETVRAMPAAPFIIIGGYVIAGLVAFPLTLLIIATVIAFGGGWGFAYALTGSLLSAMVTYYIGERIGRNAVRKLAGSRINTISQYLARHGIITIVAVRIIPVAPFTVINLVAGASHINFRDYATGTVLGMAPGIVAISLIADRVRAVLQNPAMSNIAWLVATVGLIILAAVLLVKWLMRRAKKENIPLQSS
jgi:uncharacterized membrane protein YdjX (TVP38/TMEM64 family)